MARAKPKPREIKRSWKVIPKTKKIECFEDPADDCHVTGLWTGGRSDFHDAELQTATSEINKILDRVMADNEDTSRQLRFIRTEGRILLVWSHPSEASSADTEGDLRRLKIQR